MMPNPVPLCTHVKADGIKCGSPAVSGTELCYHHSAVKTQLGKMPPVDQVPFGAFTPIPFIFPEDRASLQINHFLLFQAFAEQRVERRAAELMFRMLKEMGRNLGKSGSLIEASDQRSAASNEASDQRSVASEGAASQEAVSIQAGAAVGPIAPESCFSKKPAVRARDNRDLFRMSPLDRQDYTKPARPWLTDRRFS